MNIQRPDYSVSHGILTVTELLSWAMLPAGAVAGMMIADFTNSSAAGFGLGAMVAASGILGVAMAAVAKASLHTSQTAYAILDHLRGVSPAPSIEEADASLPIDPPPVGWTTKTIKGRRGAVNLTVDEYGFINAKTSFGTKQFRTEEEAVAYFA
jgi:hypothetical protein